MSGLPAGLLQAVRELASAQDGLKRSAGRISAHYRDRGASRGVIGNEAEAVAYALSRMPATYAAMAAVLDELQERAPGFAPGRLLDVGAGPGTAAWAAVEAYPELDVRLVDHNRAMLALAETLGASVTAGAVETSVGEIGGVGAERFDLVSCAYALTELGESELAEAARRLWAACGGVLVIVEPGRPREHERLMAVRRQLIAAGAEVLAPCPHANECPLVVPDWCHFSVRLARSREHMHLKGGALGYEDEKYSYLVVARAGIGAAAAARVIKPQRANKFSVTLPLCAADGLEERVLTKADGPAYKQSKKLDWGDALD